MAKRGVFSWIEKDLDTALARYQKAHEDRAEAQQKLTKALADLTHDSNAFAYGAT